MYFIVGSSKKWHMRILIFQNSQDLTKVLLNLKIANVPFLCYSKGDGDITQQSIDKLAKTKGGGTY